MSLKTQQYYGNVVEAVQLTKDNAQEVATWIDGRVVEHTFTQEVDENHSHQGTATRVHLKKKPTRKGAWGYGSVGDWFVKDQSGIVRIFSENVFPKIFSAHVPLTAESKK